MFGPYPFDAYGGVVIADSRISLRPGDAEPAGLLGELLPARARTPRWSPTSWPTSGSATASRWPRWEDIWLNEGFATYAEWLWAEHTEAYTAKEAFDSRYAEMSAQVWKTPPGKPGVEKLFSESVYQRGGMTLHALRVAVGDKAFFEILKTWAAEKRDGIATTAEFVALAERVSGKQLDALFDAWLYGTKKPALPKRL